MPQIVNILGSQPFWFGNFNDAELESPKSFDAFQDVANYLNSIGLAHLKFMQVIEHHV